MREMNDDIKQYRLWIETRFDPTTLPKHKLLSRQLHHDMEPTLTIHTAGQKVVWEISIREAVLDAELLNHMSAADRELIQWIYKNDCDVDNYCYQE